MCVYRIVFNGYVFMENGFFFFCNVVVDMVVYNVLVFVWRVKYVVKYVGYFVIGW